MTDEKVQYRKLVRFQSTGFFRWGSLWQGSDHLLFIESRRITEDYRRFYFKDIQAFITRKTAYSTILNVLFGIGAALCALLVIIVDATWIAVGFSVCFLVFLGINLLLSPSCRCHIQTAVQTTHLAPIKRLRTARRTIEKLRPLIEERQGVFNASDMPDELIVGNVDKSKAVSSITNAEQKTVSVMVPENDLLYKVLFGLYMVSAGFTAKDFFYQNTFLSLIENFCFFGVLILSIVCLVRIYIDSVSGPLLPFMWMINVYNLVIAGIGYGLTLYYTFLGQLNPGSQWEIIKLFSRLSPYDSSFLMGLTLVTFISSFGIGAGGFFLLKHLQAKTSGI